MMIPYSVIRFAHFCTLHTSRDSLGKDQTLAQRVRDVGIYLLILSASYGVFSAFRFVLRENFTLSNSICQVARKLGIINKTLAKNIYPLRGEKAIAFARKKLQEYPTLAPFVFSRGEESIILLQPVSDEVARLVALYQFFEKTFENVCLQFSYNPSENTKVVLASDDLMKIAYALNCLALENLKDSKSFTSLLKVESSQTGNAALRSEAKAYLDSVYRICFSTYHRLLNLENERLKEWFYPQEHTPDTVIFFQPGTPQYAWNQLYNDYCARVGLYIEEELEEEN